jgi:hypothetical protein
MLLSKHGKHGTAQFPAGLQNIRSDLEKSLESEDLSDLRTWLSGWTPDFDSMVL